MSTYALRAYLQIVFIFRLAGETHTQHKQLWIIIITCWFGLQALAGFYLCRSHAFISSFVYASNSGHDLAMNTFCETCGSQNVMNEWK